LDSRTKWASSSRVVLSLSRVRCEFVYRDAS
jgi:hypothetical protein